MQYANKAELMDGIIKKYHPEALLEKDTAVDGSSMTEATQAEVKIQQPPKRNPARSKQLKPLPEQQEKDCKKDSTQASQKQTGTETEAEPMLQEVNPDRQT